MPLQQDTATIRIHGLSGIFRQKQHIDRLLDKRIQEKMTNPDMRVIVMSEKDTCIE